MNTVEPVYRCMGSAAAVPVLAKTSRRRKPSRENPGTWLRFGRGALITALAACGLLGAPVASAQNWQIVLSENFGTGPTASSFSSNPAANIAPGTTDYLADSTNPVNDGSYAVVTDPSIAGFFNSFTSWISAPDHTVGDTNGYMMLLNANPARLGETNGTYYLFSTSAADIPGATYRINYYAANILRPTFGGFDAYIGVSVRGNNGTNPATGTQYGSLPGTTPMPRGTSDTALSWQNGLLQFTLPTNYTSSTLHINFYNSAPASVDTNGNDLVIDDIVIERASATLQGRVYLDNNGNGVQDAGEAAFPQPYFAAAVDINGLVVSSGPIDANGDFSLTTGLWSNTNIGQRIILSTTLPAIGSTLSSAGVPTGYELISETPPATYGSTGTLPRDGVENVLRTDTANAIVPGFNFGLRKLPILRLQKSLPSGRFVAADQFALSITGTGGPANVTTTGSGATATGTATINPGTVGAVYTLSETAAAGASLGDYATTYVCSNALVGGQAPSGGGTSFGLTAAAGDELVCTFTNTRNPLADLSIRKTNTPALGPDDQPDDTLDHGASTTYSIIVANAGPDEVNGAILRDPPGGRSGLTCIAPPTCSGAACPAGLTLAQLEGGVTLGTLANGATVTVTLACTVD